MDYIIWHSAEEGAYILDQQVNRGVFECDRTEYLRVLFRFTEDKTEDANRIFEKLRSQSIFTK